MITRSRIEMRRYSELKRLKTFKERYEYLRIGGLVGESTFGFERYLNQALYTSQKWKSIRNEVIIRDNGCDLGIEGYDIYDKIIIHHMNPLTREQMRDPDESIFDPEFLICVSHDTHNAIHYGDESLLPEIFVERRPNDTCPWLI
jgi:hypothetical protein